MSGEKRKNKLQSQEKLLDLLEAAIDGIDGYVSETGDYRYWNEKKIRQARRVLESCGRGSETVVPEESLKEYNEYVKKHTKDVMREMGLV